MRVLFAIVVAVFVAGSAMAEERSAGIENTIQSQVDAFLAEDTATAFSYASPNLKRLFGTPERFGTMVQNGYPMVWAPSEVRFLELRRQGELLFQKVLFVDKNGAPHVLEYNMMQTAQGWVIDGVQYLVAPPVGA
ncbi:uncharacterized protein DUF4864 [Litoreibacter halocynthiae]|uniref:Uncharacterized protein DUF4864 n=1 Tax=Litoreibacter halocynthiae TaxID=1242689 RepID=A0A4R7LHT2_9RHOB|nr:DUF4864 domain-containing protein [Litoreibacter halocynthiae]TDT74142.1 uncharacterized protein DUF4864 [Litoreibacter halocynthiae]